MEHFIQTPQIKANLEPRVSLSILEESVSQTVDTPIIIERWLRSTLPLCNFIHNNDSASRLSLYQHLITWPPQFRGISLS